MGPVRFSSKVESRAATNYSQIVPILVRVQSFNFRNMMAADVSRWQTCFRCTSSTVRRTRSLHGRPTFNTDDKITPKQYVQASPGTETVQAILPQALAKMCLWSLWTSFHSQFAQKGTSNWSFAVSNSEVNTWHITVMAFLGIPADCLFWKCQSIIPLSPIKLLLILNW